jgi:hypothetical protein
VSSSKSTPSEPKDEHQMKQLTCHTILDCSIVPNMVAKKRTGVSPQWLDAMLRQCSVV